MKTLKEKIEVMQAALGGEEIEIINLTSDNGNKWEPLLKPELSPFSWGGFDYRIKPEPMELWVNVYEHDVENAAYLTQENASNNKSKHCGRTIKVREVIE